MKKGEFFFQIGIAVVAVILILTSFDYPKLAGILPRTILYFLLALALIRIFALFRSHKEEILSGYNLEWNKGTKRLFFIIGTTVLYIIVIQFLGFYVTSAIFIAMVPSYLGYKNLKLRLLAMVIVIGFMYVMFELLLNTPLPRGFLGI